MMELEKGKRTQRINLGQVVEAEDLNHKLSEATSPTHFAMDQIPCNIRQRRDYCHLVKLVRRVIDVINQQ